jgi:small GTP-binding protein
MTDLSAKLYIQASCRQPSALGVFQAYGPEVELAASLDGRLGKKGGSQSRKYLRNNELKYGWLYRADGVALDEAMLAKPGEAMRVLMTHGGLLTCRRVEEYLIGEGFDSLEAASPEIQESWRRRDELLDPLLAGCLTQEQAAALLEFRAGIGPFPEQLLLTRRLLLAGPPNAGKSSLFNRLAGYERAFVHEEAGATRDVVDELVDLGGFAVLLGDLPGFSPWAGGLDLEAGRRARSRLELAEAVLFVCDASRDWDAETEEAAALTAAAMRGGREGGSAHPALVVLNKSDLPARLEGRPWERHFPEAESLRVSSLPGGDAAEKLAEAAWRLWKG